MSAAAKPIPLTIPDLGDEECAAAAAVIRSGWVTQGPRVADFEREFAARVGAGSAVAVANCTAALHLALLAAGVGPGDCVITASHSFIATANAIRHCGAEPWFVDVDALDLNLDPAALANALTRDFSPGDRGLRLRDTARLLASPESPWRGRAPAGLGRLAAVLVVHQVGRPADLARILPLARVHGLPVVEDAACAAGSAISLDGGATFAPVGRPHGDLACFSFHPRKVITTGDGGMIVPSSPEQERRLRLLRQHGMAVPDLARHAAREVIVESYAETGYNYRMTDVQAAIGRVQLRRLDGLVARRVELAEAYRSELSAVPGLRVAGPQAWARWNWQSFIVDLPAAADQHAVMTRMLAAGIATRPGIMCAHLEAPYARAWPVGSLPGSEAARRHGLLLPLYPRMERADVSRVVAALAAALA